MELTINNLEKCFYAARVKNKKYVGVLISMPKFSKPEIIINPISDFDGKFEYYKNAYNENLTLKIKPLIKIIGFTYGDSFEEIEKDLLV